MSRDEKPCPPELLDFCQQELQTIMQQIDEVLQHIAKGETLAALGAWDGVERRMTVAGAALHLIARLYPNTQQSRLQLDQS